MARVGCLVAWLLLICLTTSDACTQVFDVTDFGAIDGGNDSTVAFLAAWRAACRFRGNASFLIPEGTFLLGPVNFEGPCQNGTSPSVEIRGRVKAHPDLKSYSESTWIKFYSLNKLAISGGGILDGQGAHAWPHNNCHRNTNCQMLPVSLRFSKITNSTLSRISLVDSKSFHMSFYACKNVEVRDLRITAPDNSPNTDGIHLGISEDIRISDSVIGTGDDCISIGPGSNNIFVSNVTCGPGHGISVGSLGKNKNDSDVIGLHVSNCTLINTDNGLRIKTWPGLPSSKAYNITFEDIIMKNVSNPIIVDQQYCPEHSCSKEPSHVEISDIRFKRIRGTSQTKVAVNFLCSRAVPCRDVELRDINLCSLHDCNTTSSFSNVNGTFFGEQIPIPCLSCLEN